MMARGGKRTGSGQQLKWGEATVVVRVPVSLVDEVKTFVDLKAGVLNAPDEPIQPSERRKPQADPEEGLVTCHECRHLSLFGQCLNAKAAVLPENYRLVPNMPRRCEGFELDEEF